MRKWLKRIGYVLGGLVGLLVVAYLAVHVVTSFRIARKYDRVHVTVAVPEGPEAIERGRHLVETVLSCQDCHGEDLGGKVMVESFAIGRLAGANITPAGVVAGYTVEDWVRSIRHGLDRHSRPLLVMPSENYQHLSDEDLGALIAYLRTVPAVERNLGKPSVGPLARVLYLAGVLPLVNAEHIDHRTGPRSAPPRAATKEYGRYLAETAGCTHCHGATLGGGKSPAPGFLPPPRIARLSEMGWDQAAFVRAMREGLRPDGSAITDQMPWRAFGKMSDDELGALWLFVESKSAPTAMATSAPPSG